ncbi:MAG: hypothetical protein GT600_13240 [Bacteroidales bacterium]|jgi:hypothetical protein|nr:hypothetical protein [Bacteroidales bacterium]NMD02717.1 hypothetical protein [Bacteroidales bacterium]OQB60822.1 MAG: hypothetical protein BWX96_02014 [Bacteroidetes bacterium ADurb.Bin145]HOU02348.1 hypothetical protein [Bacteroidales bacterium]HQK67073.1 hypothetical protein [Bacteroidales bacterium]
MKKSIKTYLNIILWTCFVAGNTGFLSGQGEAREPQPQFLFPAFHDSKVLMKTGKVQNLLMNYNSLTETMVYMSGSDIYDMVNPGQVDTVFIQNRKFIPVGKAFYEVLKGGDMPLYCQTKSELKPVGRDAGYGSKSLTSAITSYANISSSGTNYNLKIPPDYVVDTKLIYWINKTISFETERQFLKLFPENAEELKAYIKKNRLKFENQDHVIEMVRYCSELISKK